MNKNLPPRTLAALRMPNKTYRYFQDWQAHPFKHDANAFELVNAWWLMETSLLAYADANFIAATFETTGLTAAGFGVEFIEQARAFFLKRGGRFVAVDLPVVVPIDEVRLSPTRRRFNRVQRRDRRAEALEDLLGLIFVNVHLVAD